jgi:ethanolamine utilization protein EutN
MTLARIVGTATSTVKHRSLNGCRLMLCEAITEHGDGTGDFMLAADYLGAGIGTEVLISSDGDLAFAHHGDKNSPLRDGVIGIVDRKEHAPA